MLVLSKFLTRCIARRARRLDGGLRFEDGWYVPPGPMSGDERRNEFHLLRDAEYAAQRVCDEALAERLRKWRFSLKHQGYGRQLVDADALTLGALPRSLVFVHNDVFAHHVFLERVAARRMDDAAVQAYPELPCLARAEAVPASAAPGAVTFDAAFPALSRLGRAAGAGFTLGLLCEQGNACNASAWTAEKNSFVHVDNRSGFLDHANGLRGVLSTLERRCARAQDRLDAGLAFGCNYNSDDDSDADAADDDDAAGGGSETENEPPAADAANGERAAKRTRHGAPASAQPPWLNVVAAFPLIAELLTRMGSKPSAARYWLFCQSGVLRLFRGAWLGTRGVVAAGCYKEPTWVARRRYAAVHDALAELEAHLLVNTARGRAFLDAPAKAARQQAREAAKAARLQAEAVRAAKARARARARAAREAAKAAREQARAAKAAPAPAPAPAPAGNEPPPPLAAAAQPGWTASAYRRLSGLVASLVRS